MYYADELNPKPGGQGSFRTLRFTFQFQAADDTCYFAHCYPYTFTRLQVPWHVLLEGVCDLMQPQQCIFFVVWIISTVLIS